MRDCQCVHVLLSHESRYNIQCKSYDCSYEMQCICPIRFQMLKMKLKSNRIFSLMTMKCIDASSISTWCSCVLCTCVDTYHLCSWNCWRIETGIWTKKHVFENIIVQRHLSKCALSSGCVRIKSPNSYRPHETNEILLRRINFCAWRYLFIYLFNYLCCVCLFVFCFVASRSRCYCYCL